jgi:simple sugar transport system substrate-binding protein
MVMGSIRTVSRRTVLTLGAAAVASVLGAAPQVISQAQAKDPLKVGFVYVGPVGDFGWSHQHNEGRKAIEAALGAEVKTAFVEDVPEGADAERVINQFAQQGFDLVFTTSFGFMNPTLKVAKRYPGVKFEHATGYKRADNLSTYAARFYEGRAVIGTMAGMMTKSNVVGYIASVPIPEVVRGVNAFTLAAQKVNPDVQVKVIWVNSWYDPGKEREAAEALVAQGADILTQHTDSPAAMQVAEERGLYAFGQASDMHQFGPKAQLTSIVDDWSSYYVARAKAVQDGTWTSTDTWGGLKAGMVKMAPYGDAVPADVRVKADAVRDAIIAGRLHPFTGPIFNQDGVEMVKAGDTIPDADLLSMNWFVKGVQGQVPK